VSHFRNNVLVWMLLAAFSFSFVPSVSLAQQPTATISALSGTVLVNGQETGKGKVLSAGDVIETQAGASVVLELSDGSLLELGENTKVNIAELSQTATGVRVSWVKLMWGRIQAKLSPEHQQTGSSFDIETPNALVGVKFSQPDVKVSYDPAKQETVALALTVALAVKNLITDEEKIIPIGSIAIITALGIKVAAGAAVATGAMGAEAAAAEATAGIGTTAKVAIGAGAVAAAGGAAAVVASAGDDGDGDMGEELQQVSGTWKMETSITYSGGEPDCICGLTCNNSLLGRSGSYTFDVQQSGSSFYSDSWSPTTISGTISNTSVIFSVILVDGCGDYVYFSGQISANTIIGSFSGHDCANNCVWGGDFTATIEY
jgi:hypothetical protein